MKNFVFCAIASAAICIDSQEGVQAIKLTKIVDYQDAAKNNDSDEIELA